MHSLSSTPVGPQLLSIHQEDDSAPIELTYDGPLAGFTLGGGGGFRIFSSAVEHSIDHVSCADESTVVEIFPDLPLFYDRCIYDGITPAIEYFAGPPGLAAAFDHPIDWP